jgi:hypothetical protein
MQPLPWPTQGLSVALKGGKLTVPDCVGVSVGTVDHGMLMFDGVWANTASRMVPFVRALEEVLKDGVTVAP